MLFILIAGAAFAQMAPGLFMNAWGRAAFVPLWVETPELQYGEPKSNSEAIFYNGTGITWVPNKQPRVDFRLHGFNDFLGFTIHINAEMGDSVGNGDNGAQIWVKPFGNDILKLTAANQFIDDTLRGKVSADSGFENFILGKSMMKFSNGREPLNQDVIFNRYGGGRGSTAAADLSNTSTWISTDSIQRNVFFLSSSPVKGMFVGLMLQGVFPSTELKETWRQMQLGVGYEIPGIGHARAQYIGGFMGKEKDVTDMFRLNEPSKFEAAFAYTGTRNLVIDVGLKYWTPVTKFNDTKSFRGIDIGAGAYFRNGPFNFTGMVEVLNLGAYTGYNAHTPTNDFGVDPIHLTFNLIPAIDFDFGSFGLSMIFQTKTADTLLDASSQPLNEKDKTSPWTRFGLGVWYRKGLLGGYIKTGVTWASPYIATSNVLVWNPTGGAGGTGAWEKTADLKTGLNGRSIITIPVIFEYAFF